MPYMYCDCTRNGVVYHNGTKAHITTGIPGEFSTVIAPQDKHIFLCWFRISTAMEFLETFQGKQRARAYLWLNILIVMRRTVRRDRGSASTMHFAPVVQFS